MTTVKDTSLLDERKFTNNQTADMLGISRRTLPVWRKLKRGPAPTYHGARVFYYESKIQAWIEQNTRTSAPQA